MPTEKLASCSGELYFRAQMTGRSHPRGNGRPLASSSEWSRLNCPAGIARMSAVPRHLPTSWSVSGE